MRPTLLLLICCLGSVSMLQARPHVAADTAEISADHVRMYAASHPARYREIGVVSASHTGRRCSRDDGLVGGLIDVLLKVQPHDGCASGANAIHWNRVAPSLMQQLREKAASLGADAVIDIKAYTTRDCGGSLAFGSDEQEHAWVEGIAVKSASAGRARR